MTAEAGAGDIAHHWRAFCDQLASAGEVLLRPEAPRTPLEQAEGLRYLSRLARTAIKMQVDCADPQFPALFAISDETVKIGADNPDNLYHGARVSGAHDYRISGTVGSVPYLSVGSKADRYATEGTMVSSGEIELADMTIEPDGRFEIVASATRRPGNWLPMASDTTLLVIRQTFNDKRRERPAEFRIERISPGLDYPELLTPERITAQLDAAAAWVRGTANTFADWAEWFKRQPNRFYDGDQSVFQKAGGDPRIWYGHLYYDLAPGEALIIRAHPPECRLWNFQLDNWWMESLDYVNRKVWVNNSQARYEDDGSVVIVCADADPGYGNWIDLAGHRTGTALWRWTGASEHPVPDCEVIPV